MLSMTCRGYLLLVSSMLLGLVAAPLAPAKEGVQATLTAPLALDAPPGKRITVTWTLRLDDDTGKHRPFGAGGVFVRLLSASGGPPAIGFAGGGEHARGEYAAAVVVPEGGIGGIEIGIRGWNDFGVSDAMFPIRIDPLAAPAGSFPTRLASALAGRALGVLAIVAVIVRAAERRARADAGCA